ncbi:hypothetical protein Hanom_Chr04g00299791 [Helianthus anomalus]
MDNLEVPSPYSDLDKNLTRASIILQTSTYTNIGDTPFSVGRSPPQNGNSGVQRASGASGLGEGTPKNERSNDMFSDDIFGESPAGVRKSGKGDGLTVQRSGLQDNWDDRFSYALNIKSIYLV